MNVKEAIANRITSSRKALGITIKELAARTKILSAARISNWEQGTRSPGPIEAKLLSEHLKVSASYILCLTDNPQGELSHPSGKGPRVIPVLSMKDAQHAKELFRSGYDYSANQERTIIVDGFNKSHQSEYLFAVIIEDNSMQPGFNSGDLVVLDGELKPKPGDYVLAYLPEKKQSVFRQYGEADGCLFQLLASNDLWTAINVKSDDVIVVGVVVEYRRYF